MLNIIRVVEGQGLRVGLKTGHHHTTFLISLSSKAKAGLQEVGVQGLRGLQAWSKEGVILEGADTRLQGVGRWSRQILAEGPPSDFFSETFTSTSLRFEA